jgi:hypothetical protein
MWFNRTHIGEVVILCVCVRVRVYVHQSSEHLFLHKIQLKKFVTQPGLKSRTNSTAGYEVSWNNCALETLHLKSDINQRNTSIINFVHGPVIDMLNQ